MKQFVCNTKIISGENALDALKTLDAQKVMVVTDPFFMEILWTRTIKKAS